MRISQTMIVKNEEQNIRQALSWGRGLVSEQFVVDTGSTDRTREIAASLGAEVRTFQWVNDFSAAKNYALSLCSGDWIAIFDADEYVVAGDAGKVKGILAEAASLGANVVSASLLQMDEDHQVYSGGTLIRFLKNGEGIHYEGAVHEQLYCKSGIREFDATAGLSMVHTGYTAEAMQRKRGRNLQLIQEALRQDPENFEMLGYLGDEYRAMEDLPRAEQAYREALRHAPRPFSFSGSAHGGYGGSSASAPVPVPAPSPSRIGNADARRDASQGIGTSPPGGYEDQRLALDYTYLLEIVRMRRDREEELLRLYREATEALPKEADFAYAVAYFYYYFGEYREAAGYFKEAIGKLERFGIHGKGLHLSTKLKEAYEMLAFSCLCSGAREDAVQYAAIVLKLDKDAYLGLQTLLWAFSGRQPQTLGKLQAAAPPAAVPGDAALRFLSGIYDLGKLHDRLILYKAALETGYRELQDGLSAYLSEKEKRAFT